MDTDNQVHKVGSSSWWEKYNIIRSLWVFLNPIQRENALEAFDETIKGQGREGARGGSRTKEQK